MSETKQQCCVAIFERWGARNCSRKATVVREGKSYCSTHDPEVIAAHRASRNAKRDAQWAEKSKRHKHIDICVQFHERLVEALRGIDTLSTGEAGIANCLECCGRIARTLLSEISKAAE